MLIEHYQIEPREHLHGFCGLHVRLVYYLRKLDADRLMSPKPVLT